MKYLFNLIVLLSIVCLSFTEKDNSLSDNELLDFVSKTSEKNLEHHVAVLAHDSMKGRYPGTPEYQKAMNYVARQFKAMDLKPLGDKEGSSYFQPLTLRNVKTDESKSFMLLNGKDPVKYGEDYYFISNANQLENEFSGEVVFVGYGVDAPEHGYNDFENLDVKGKVMVMFTGAPESFPSSERAYFNSTDNKLKTAVDKGAVGIFLVTNPSGENKFDRYYAYSKRKGTSNVVTPAGEAFGRSSYSKNLKAGGYMNQTFLAKLIGQPIEVIYEKYQSGEILQPKDKKVLSGKSVGIYTEIKSANVVGLMEGTSLKDEYIVHSAHLDHVGIGKPVNGDSIYNGAQDNAVGIASMLEIARLYHEMKEKPKRSVIFLAVTAEEMGLLGSKYFAENPTVPIEDIVANVNTDMPVIIAPLLSIEPIGAEHSTLKNEVYRVAELLDLRVDDDHMPEEVRFVRSDQLSFVLKGIPALNIDYGLKVDDPNMDLEKMIHDWDENHYHKPSDELNESIDWAAGVKFTQLNFMLSYLVNMAEKRPEWNEGDVFARFKTKS